MKDRWTTEDFEELSWHDCHVHAVRIGPVNEESGTSELELDLDFILEWLPQGDRAIHFRVAPATLTFHDVFGLRILLDYVSPSAGMTPFALDGIDRERLTYSSGHGSYRWRLPVNWPEGEITFESPGFTQVLRREPVVMEAQGFAAHERGD